MAWVFASLGHASCPHWRLILLLTGPDFILISAWLSASLESDSRAPYDDSHLLSTLTLVLTGPWYWFSLCPDSGPLYGFTLGSLWPDSGSYYSLTMSLTSARPWSSLRPHSSPHYILTLFLSIIWPWNSLCSDTVFHYDFGPHYGLTPVLTWHWVWSSLSPALIISMAWLLSSIQTVSGLHYGLTLVLSMAWPWSSLYPDSSPLYELMLCLTGPDSGPHWALSWVLTGFLLGSSLGPESGPHYGPTLILMKVYNCLTRAWLLSSLWPVFLPPNWLQLCLLWPEFFLHLTLCLNGSWPFHHKALKIPH